jgi:mono/diheme cytochrome c family protein
MRSLAILLLFTLISFKIKAAPPVEEGKTIFASRCAACHNVNKTVTGPALAGVGERRSIEWIVKFVTSSQALIKSGDKDAIALFEQFNKIPMPDHSDLNESQIKSIVDYIKSETVSATNVAPFAKPKKLRAQYTPLSINNYAFFITYLSLVALMISGMVFAVHVKSLQRNLKRNS